MITAKTDKDLKPVLMENVKKGLKTPYYTISDNNQLIFVVVAGKNGAEFSKTVGYFSNFAGIQIYQVLYGLGIIIMQRNEAGGEAKEFKIVTLSPGKQALVPAGWGMCIVNTGVNLLVVIRTSSLDEKDTDQKPVLDKKGFAYFVVEKKGEISFEQNPTYRVHPQITIE